MYVCQRTVRYAYIRSSLYKYAHTFQHQYFAILFSTRLNIIQLDPYIPTVHPISVIMESIDPMGGGGGGGAGYLCTVAQFTFI